MVIEILWQVTLKKFHLLTHSLFDDMPFLVVSTRLVALQEWFQIPQKGPQYFFPGDMTYSYSQSQFSIRNIRCKLAEKFSFYTRMCSNVLK